MSYQNGTPNFNLPQTVGSDKRDWSDTNQAFADLDAAVGNNTSDVALALTTAQTAQTSADGAVTDAAAAVSAANAATAQASAASEMASLARTEAQSAVTTAGQAQTTAQAAQTTASNADTIALRAEGKADTANSNIGTMTDLQTTDKTSLVAAINEVLSQIGGGAMPTLNFTTPLHNFRANNLSYTAVKDCYVCGYVYGTSNAECVMSVNNHEIAQSVNVEYSGERRCGCFVSPLKLSAGDVVSVNIPSDKLYVYEEVSQ